MLFFSIILWIFVMYAAYYKWLVGSTVKIKAVYSTGEVGRKHNAQQLLYLRINEHRTYPRNRRGMGFA